MNKYIKGGCKMMKHQQNKVKGKMLSIKARFLMLEVFSRWNMGDMWQINIWRRILWQNESFGSTYVVLFGFNIYRQNIGRRHKVSWSLSNLISWYLDHSRPYFIYICLVNATEHVKMGHNKVKFWYSLLGGWKTCILRLFNI